MSQPKTSRQLLPSLPRTATVSSGPQKDAQGARALRAYLNVTDASGDGGLTVVFNGIDPVSGNPVALSAGGVPVLAPGTYAYEMTPFVSQDSLGNLIAGNILESVSRAVPYVWSISVLHANDSPYTYSLGVEVLGN
jgi:hypothetical protein